MVEVTFYIIRHGFSCSNLKKHKKRVFEQKLSKDPHLTNWGIIGSILAGIELRSNIFSKIKFKYYFCSPLLRTWETAACLFAPTNKMQVNVAPHLREFFHKKLGKYLVTADDTPNSFHKNQKKFNKFKGYTLELYKRYLKLNKNSQIKRLESEIKNIENVHVKFHKKRYSNKYTDQGDIYKFISWYLKKAKPTKNQNIAVICHGILMKTFVKSLNKDVYNEMKKYGANNKVIKIKMVDGKIVEIQSIYDGIRYPTNNELKNIRTTCSMCKTLFSLSNTSCKNNKELLNFKVQDKFIKQKLKEIS
tara:strand:+ start:832 stop:1743 length:912 start_codon:yes stop_codon:yes gene_type:complete